MVEQTPYLTVPLHEHSPYEEKHVKASSTTPPIKIEVVSQTLDLGTPELNTMVISLWIFLWYQCMSSCDVFTCCYVF